MSNKKTVISFASNDNEDRIKNKVISFASDCNREHSYSNSIDLSKTCEIETTKCGIQGNGNTCNIDRAKNLEYSLNTPISHNETINQFQNKALLEPNSEMKKIGQKDLVDNYTNKSKLKSNRVIYTNSTYHTNPRNFYSDINGTYVELLNSDFTTKTIKLCNFTISVISKLITYEITTKRNTSYKIKCTLNDIAKEKTIEITMYDLRTKENFLNKIGGEFVFIAEENAFDYFKEYISELIKIAPEEVIYSSIGWRKFGNNWAYIIGNKCIGLNCNINCTQDKALRVDKKLTAINSAQLSLDMLNISNKLDKTLPLLLYSHLGLMKSLFTEAKAMPRFILWIYGETGSMKTSISKCFFSIFNNCDDISATFKYTKAALEIKSSEYADSCLLVDDYHPTTTRTEKVDMDSKAGMLLRIYGDEASTGRGTQNMQKTIEVTSRGLCVITGENKFGSKSDLARLITVEITKDDIIPSVLSHYQNNPKLYPTHIYYFLSWVAINAEAIIEFIQKRVAILRIENQGLYSHKRYVDSYILLCITAEILLNYYTSIGLNLNNQAIYHKWSESLKKMIQIQDSNMMQQDPGIMFIIALQNMLIGNTCTLEEINGEQMNKTNSIGYKDDKYLYLSAELAYEKVCKFWRGQGIEYPLTKDASLESLERIKVLETKDEGGDHRRTVKCSIKGISRRRYAKLIISEIDKLLNDI